ncbi:regulator of Ty1 transposition [Scheffersomyces coipomensis]|uniref:regulator of Ty1 transposition n=1 Tax=Scheffersomyces coipomensis TaxID=1788519 RepID=UPI00315DAD66
MTLQDELSKQLPQYSKFKLFHIQTKPTYIKSPIHFQPLKLEQVQTIKIRHLIQLIDEDDLIVLGIEIYIYIQMFGDRVEQTIFISKCDTVGLTKLKFKVNDVIQVIINWLINYNLYDYKIKVKSGGKVYKPIDRNDKNNDNDTIIAIKKLITKLNSNPQFLQTLPYYNDNNNSTKISNDQQKNLLTLPLKQTIKLCLFTKAANQYLYPYSSKNSFKHIINGIQLLKWWLKTIDKTFTNWNCRLLIPGSDDLSTQKFLNDLNINQWKIGNIYGDNNDKELAIHSIPVYPDDPKGRFLEHLIVENRYHKLTINQFYHELGFRQEFRLGNLVGLIGCKSNEIDIIPPVNKEQQISSAAVILTIHQYKQLVNNLIKAESFTNKNDIQNLIREKIPNYLERLGNEDMIYHEIIGNKVETVVSTTTKVTPQVINTLTVKRKAPTDLTNLIKKKKKK